MSRKKTLPTLTKPFAHVHSTLTALGFNEKSQAREGTTYELMFHDPATYQGYPFRVHTHTQETGQTMVNLAEAGFAGRTEPSPAVQDAAEQMMCEVQEYLGNGPVKTKSTPIDEAMNGKMANNEEEVKQLGRSMANYPTNAQVRESGLVPDPIQ